MNLYTHDLSWFEFADLSDPIIDDPFSLPARPSSPPAGENDESPAVPRPKSPPRHPHDGTSPLPMGMDWSLPPRKWDGRDTIWPHDPRTGWSYCVTIPSWILLPKSKGSNLVVFYRVQVGVQSPEGTTSVHILLRRYSDFLTLVSELMKAFPSKEIPPAPPGRMLRIKSRSTLLNERRCSLEDWMDKLLSDIDISRSVVVGTFLELETAARMSFHDAYQQHPESSSFYGGVISSALIQLHSDMSMLAGSSSIASDHGNNSQNEISDSGTPRDERDGSVELGLETSTSEPNLVYPTGTALSSGLSRTYNILENIGRLSNWKLRDRRKENIMAIDKFGGHMSIEKPSPWDDTQSLPELEYQGLGGHVRRLSTESMGTDFSSVKASEITNFGASNLRSHDALGLLDGAKVCTVMDAPTGSNVQWPRDSTIVYPTEEHLKLSRVLISMQQRIAAAKTDMEDLIARLNQEVAVRQFLTTKVKYLEVDLETTTDNCRDNVQQAVVTEKEKFTQMQWDIEDLRRQCLELELKLQSEQDEKGSAEAAKVLILHENKLLLHQLDLARDELRKLHRAHEELEMKSKADVKLLVKEVKSLRTYQSELKQELGSLMKEKLETERVLQKEKERTEHTNVANDKLLHECDILRNRLQECSVNFLSEEEDRLTVEASSPSDAIDILTTSDNRIGLLLAEAQLLEDDVENSVPKSDGSRGTSIGDEADNRLRKMLTEMFVDNARLRMQVNAVIRCSLTALVKSDEDDNEEETPLRRTLLSKFLQG